MTKSRSAEVRSRHWPALGFAATVSMWGAAYLARLPAVMAPSWLLGVVLMALVAWWGALAGRWTGAGWRAGWPVGVTAAVLNMLILGSLLADDGGGRSALIWVPGSVALLALVAGVSAAVGRRFADAGERTPDWTAVFSKVGVAATLLLVSSGGLVTSHEAGLAVVDWPNTFGSNMFLYPLSRMTGGVYYEHAHRLFGALVGLTTTALAVQIVCSDRRRWVRRLAALAVPLVVLQGLLGGLRVTGRLTLSSALEDMAPSLALAVVHGVTGQLFFVLMVTLAVVTSVAWRREPETARGALAGTGSGLQWTLVLALVGQLVLGAFQRHMEQGLLIHIVLAALVTLLAVAVGARAWGLAHGLWPLQHLGQALMSLVGIQVALGIAALAVTGGRAVVGNPSQLEVTLATAHQVTGAVLLATAVTVLAWTLHLAGGARRPSNGAGSRSASVPDGS